MDSIKNMVRRLRDFDNNLDKIVIEQAAKFERDILNWNKEQLYAGIDAKENDLQPDYTRHTKIIKQGKTPPQPTDRVTLYDTGDFYNSFFLINAGTQLEVYATDWKRNKLFKKYGPELFGLIDQFKQDLIGKVEPLMINEFRKRILK
jgi:hypothetical protein